MNIELKELELTRKDFMYCYDGNLTRFLKSKGILYLLKGRDLRDNRIFTVYYSNNALQDALNEWEQASNTNK